ncbi:MAG: hypothetical protein OEW75_02360 [Cyclobacteriaceae bacterium]|nr:hypothetical protein [Cyclobacteriaceae bacterium]
MHIPFCKGESAGSVQMFMGYDEEYLWISAAMHHPNSVPMRSISIKGDSADGSNGCLRLIL